MGFRATLYFRKFKVALNPMYRIVALFPILFPPFHSRLFSSLHSQAQYTQVVDTLFTRDFHMFVYLFCNVLVIANLQEHVEFHRLCMHCVHL